MKMDLEYPYNKDWKFGYIQINPEGRKTVILFNSEKDRSSTAYARYLLAVNEGRYLTNNEEADHIDTDHTNDEITNLQILTITEHKKKTISEQSRETLIEFTCQCCGILFQRNKRKVTKTTKYCSQSCARNATLRIRDKDTVNILLTDIDKIKNLVDRGLGDKEIASIYKVHKSTIYNFRKQFNIKGRNQKIKDILKENQVEILSMRESGLSFNKIALKFNLEKKVILRFFNRKGFN